MEHGIGLWGRHVLGAILVQTSHGTAWVHEGPFTVVIFQFHDTSKAGKVYVGLDELIVANVIRERRSRLLLVSKHNTGARGVHVSYEPTGVARASRVFIPGRKQKNEALSGLFYRFTKRAIVCASISPSVASTASCSFRGGLQIRHNNVSIAPAH